MARAPHQDLDTIESRKISLAKHLKHSDWTSPTPYISFTNSAAAVQDLVNVRAQRNRSNQTLTAIDPNTRLRKGLPILDECGKHSRFTPSDILFEHQYTRLPRCFWPSFFSTLFLFSSSYYCASWLGLAGV